MSKAILSSLQGQYFWWLSIFMDSKLQPVQLYGFSKSRLYEPLGTAIFFRNRFCPVSWILLFLPVHFYGYSLITPIALLVFAAHHRLVVR